MKSSMLLKMGCLLRVVVVVVVKQQGPSIVRKTGGTITREETMVTGRVKDPI